MFDLNLGRIAYNVIEHIEKERISNKDILRVVRIFEFHVSAIHVWKFKAFAQSFLYFDNSVGNFFCYNILFDK